MFNYLGCNKAVAIRRLFAAFASAKLLIYIKGWVL
jgi:hypothetical protein